MYVRTGGFNKNKGEKEKVFIATVIYIRNAEKGNICAMIMLFFFFKYE